MDLTKISQHTCVRAWPEDVESTQISWRPLKILPFQVFIQVGESYSALEGNAGRGAQELAGYMAGSLEEVPGVPYVCLKGALEKLLDQTLYVAQMVKPDSPLHVGCWLVQQKTATAQTGDPRDRVVALRPSN